MRRVTCSSIEHGMTINILSALMSVTKSMHSSGFVNVLKELMICWTSLRVFFVSSSEIAIFGSNQMRRTLLMSDDRTVLFILIIFVVLIDFAPNVVN